MYNLFRTLRRAPKPYPVEPTLLILANEGCVASPLGNVHLSILQTLKSRTPLLV